MSRLNKAVARNLSYLPYRLNSPEKQSKRVADNIFSLANMTEAYIYRDQLHTKRLITRFLTPQDIAPWTQFFRDKEAIEYLSTFGSVSCEDMSKHWVERQILRYQEQRLGLQALINKATGEFIGQCGLITHEIHKRLEIGISYHIFKQYWGYGYGTEAAKCFIDFAFANDITSSIISIIDINNVKSQRVAEKNGLVREQQTRWAHHDVYIYRITRDR
jgi:ribosomal-protein-alanine N-acetyltransferase